MIGIHLLAILFFAAFSDLAFELNLSTEFFNVSCRDVIFIRVKHLATLINQGTTHTSYTDIDQDQIPRYTVFGKTLYRFL